MIAVYFCDSVRDRGEGPVEANRTDSYELALVSDGASGCEPR